MDQFKQIISSSNNIYILGHYNTDFDCYMSMLFMGYLVNRLFNKTPHLVLSNPVIKEASEFATSLGLKFEVKSWKELQEENLETVIIVDMAYIGRFNIEEMFVDTSFIKNKIKFDHHESEVDDKYIFQVVNKADISTTMLLWKYFKDEISKLDDKDKFAEIALIGLISDMVELMDPPGPEAFKVIGEILSFGADYIKSQSVALGFDLSVYKLASELFDDIKYSDNGFHYLFVDQMYYDASIALTIQAVDLVKRESKNIKDIKLLVVFQKQFDLDGKHFYQVRFRSNARDILPILKKMNGGGHMYAGGGNVEADNDNDVLDFISGLV